MQTGRGSAKVRCLEVSEFESSIAVASTLYFELVDTLVAAVLAFGFQVVFTSFGKHTGYRLHTAVFKLG